MINRGRSNNNKYIVVIVHGRLIKQSRRTSNVTDPIHSVTLFVTPRTSSGTNGRGRPVIYSSLLLLFTTISPPPFFLCAFFFFIVHTNVTHPIHGGGSLVLLCRGRDGVAAMGGRMNSNVNDCARFRVTK